MIKAVEIKRNMVPGDANTTEYKSRYQFSGSLQSLSGRQTLERQTNKGNSYMLFLIFSKM